MGGREVRSSPPTSSTDRTDAMAPTGPRASGRRCRPQASRCGRDVQRTGIPADEQSAASDQRSQLLQIELAEIHDRGRPLAESLPRGRRDSERGFPIGGPGAQDQIVGARPPAARCATRSTKKGSGHRRNGLPALTCTTISWCASEDARVAQTPRHPGIRTGVEHHLDRIRSTGSGCLPATPGSPASKSHWFATECLGRCSRAR